MVLIGVFLPVLEWLSFIKNGFNANDTKSLKEAICKTFLEFDLELMESGNFESGSTCTSVLMTPTHFIFANVGDSRAVIVSRNRVRFETKDHKPTDFPGKYAQFHFLNCSLSPPTWISNCWKIAFKSDSVLIVAVVLYKWIV